LQLFRTEEIQQFMIAFMLSKDTVYLYQVYQIFTQYNVSRFAPIQDLLTCARSYAFGHGYPAYLRSVCRQFVGNYGMLADLERLEGEYSLASNETERAEIICCIWRLGEDRLRDLIDSLPEETRRRVTLFLGSDDSNFH
jgi:hypothetical protein